MIFTDNSFLTTNFYKKKLGEWNTMLYWLNKFNFMDIFNMLNFYTVTEK